MHAAHTACMQHGSQEEEEDEDGNAHSRDARGHSCAPLVPMAWSRGLVAGARRSGQYLSLTVE